MRGLLAAQEVEAWAAGLWIGRFKVTLIIKHRYTMRYKKSPNLGQNTPRFGFSTP